MILAQAASDGFMGWAQLGSTAVIIAMFVWQTRVFIPQLMKDTRDAVSGLTDQYIEATDKARAEYRADISAQREHSARLAERGHAVVDKLSAELSAFRGELRADIKVRERQG